MRLKSISVGGFKNLNFTSMHFVSNTIAVISPNNYGKSNLLEAIGFANDFIVAGPKMRLNMMSWKNGIPLTPGLASEPFRFEMELDEPKFGEYRYIRYSFSFQWYRDDGTGQKILDERIEMRSDESTKYSSFLKRNSGKYRRSKSTNAFRNIVLEDSVLAIDVLSSIEDLDYNNVLQAIRRFRYRVCDALDVNDHFQFSPLGFADEDDKAILFNDEDVPRAIYNLKESYPDKYILFEDAVHTLFPDFSEIAVQAYDMGAKLEGTQFVVVENSKIVHQKTDEIPYRIKDTAYRVMITSQNLNQPVSMSMMSAGTKRVFWLLANIYIASCTGVFCIGIEELETSIHPRMLKNLLEIINEALEDTCIIISSHSPYLVQYLKPIQIYVGGAHRNGNAQFFPIKTAKTKTMLTAARAYNLSVGEYLFELMSGGESSFNILQNYLEVPHSEK